MGKLPFELGTEARKKRWQEVGEKDEKPVEVNCIADLKDWEIIRQQVVIRGLNPKTGIVEDYPLIEYQEICPVCGKLMLVRAIKGTTWLALDNPECYEKYRAAHPTFFTRSDSEAKVTPNE